MAKEVKVEASKKYELNKVDLIKIGTGAGIAVGGALVTYLLEVSPMLTLEYTPL